MERSPQDPVVFTAEEVLTVLFRALAESEDALPSDHPAVAAINQAKALLVERFFGPLDD